MITCIFGLTACGSTEQVSDYQLDKNEFAEYIAVDSVVPLLVELAQDTTVFDDYTIDEIAYIMNNQYDVNAEGYGIVTALSSFSSAMEEMGGVTGVGEARCEVDDNEIIVYVEIYGQNKDAEAELIFSNDMFFVLSSAALNPKASIGELMKKAALNTVIGMGTVFIVLILISFIISCFAIIPVIQKKAADKKEAKKKATGIDNAVAQIVTQEESVNEADDLELVAVISAAIAAYEGSSGTDGYVVRSIIRRR